MAIAEVVLSAFLQVAFQAIYNRLQQERMLKHEIEEEYENLRRRVELIQALLKKTEMSHQDEHLRLWLNDLREVAYRASDVLDVLAYETQRQKLVSFPEVRQHFSKLNAKRIIIEKNINDEIRKISKKINDLKDDDRLIVVAGGGTIHRAKEHELPESTSLQPQYVLGRDNDKQNILEMLLQLERTSSEKSVSVLAIVGTFGIGKTTLAQFVYNDEAVDKHFQLKLWVDVAHDFSLRRLTKSTIESIDNSVVDVTNMDSLQRQLQSKIRGRRYLLVLDNIWLENMEEWRKFILPLLCGAEGSKILVTTRSMGVANIIDTTSPYNLRCLSDDDCWTLLCKCAGTKLHRHGSMDDTAAREILKKCKGLPLAAVSIGSQLRMENDIRKWKSILERQIHEISGNSSFLSYQVLPVHLKPCFAYCSIIPKGFEFEKEFIVHLWMAQSLIQSEGGCVEDLGSQFFDSLVQNSLFELSHYDYRRGMHRYRMPEVVHDLARHVSAEECVIIEIGNECRAETRHLSLTSGQFENNDELRSVLSAQDDIFKKIYECKGLRTLLLAGDYHMHAFDLKVPEKLPEKLKRLRTLDLSNCRLKTLPKTIGHLKHLRCLHLRNTEISKLPESIGCLYNLQILGLRNSHHLEELPSGTNYLRKLRHLDLHVDQDSKEHCMSSLRSMPPKIGLLTELRTLSRFVVGTKAGCGLGELEDLNSLQGELIISNLHLVSNVEEAVKAKLARKDIQSLQLQWDVSSSAAEGKGNDSSIIERLKPHTNLEELTVISYRGSSFPPWLSDSAFRNLEKLRLSNCSNCESLPLLGSLPMLQELHIVGMERLKVVNCQSFCSKHRAFPNFPNLEKLVFERMRSLQVWDGDKDCTLPSLRQLVFKRCLDLRQLVHSLPSLSELEIEGCPRLMGLRSYPSLRSLDVVDSGDWIWKSWRCLTNLTSLTLSSLPNVADSGDWIWKSWRRLTNLTSLTLSSLPTEALPPEAGSPHASLQRLKISGCNRLISFPSSLLPLGLVHLSFQHCAQLKHLPDVDRLILLASLEISDCPEVLRLPSLPKTLKSLKIESCPILRQRCQNDRGEDRHKIAHIPSVRID